METEYLLVLVSVALALSVGGVALYREPKRSRAKFAYAVGMALLGFESLFAGLSSTALDLPEVLAWQQWRLLTMALLPGSWLFFSLTYARGNEGEFVARWKGVLGVALIVPLGLVALAWNDLLSGETGVGPLSMRMLSLNHSGVLLNVLFTIGVILCLMNLELTLRASQGTMRWRVKYMIVGVVFLFSVRCYSAIQAVLYSAVNVDLTGLNAGALVIGCVFMFLALSRGSISAVDLYPSHRAIYGSLTVIVAGVYLLLVGLLAEVAARFQGDSSFPLHALLVLGGLGGIAILLLSDRFHQRAKRFVSLHFRRPQYDYRLVWTTFTEQTASLTDPFEFCRAATRLISDTLDVLSVTIWLVDEHGHSFSMGGSTSLSEGESRILIGDGKVSGDVARGLREHVYPTAIEEVSGQLGEVLHRLGRKQFQNGGHYFFLPLATPDEMMGILIVGDRVSALPFTAEEFDLIKTLGNQIVSNLLSIKLSRRLGDARKLEAFQTMSAFFVHDLKNTASTLSLMLQNLPKHFDDPSFRQDALRSISKSVDRINALIGRLGYFRQKMDINPVPTDLTALIKNTLAGLGGFDPEMMAIQFDPVPPVRVDPDQIQKVITNLVLNARDALGAKGKISIRTQTEEGWVVMSVADTGCGMTSQFMEQSLFHPFQTSKQDGLGIGLFHSKMIVDAHRGKIEVESQLGQGTTFRVSFPLSGEQT